MVFYRLSLKDFRGIRSIEKPLEFSKFTVIIGPQGSGKTSILEGLFLVPPINITIALVNLTKMDVLGGQQKLCPGLVYRYHGIAKVSGEVSGRSFDYILKCDSDEGWPEVSGVFGNKAIDISRIDLEEGSEELDELAEDLEVELGVHPSNLSVYIPSDIRFYLKLEKELAREELWVKIEKSGLSYRLVRDLVDKGALSDNYTDATIRGNSIVLRKETSRSVMYVKLYDIGEGIMRLLPTWIYLEMAKPNVILWDMLEEGLSPQLVKATLDLLFSKDWQVILATNSLDVLRYIANTQKSGVRVIQLRKNSDDSVSWRDIGPSELYDMLSKNIDPRSESSNR